MTEIIEQDLSGATLRKVRLSGASLEQVRLDNARWREVDLSGSQLRAVALHGVRITGAELYDVSIEAEVVGLTVNGVRVDEYVEAELLRRDPDRALLSPTDVAGYRAAWDMLTARWDRTVARARTLPAERLHESVDGEWSFIQTLRHLGFATAVWLGTMIEGEEAPWRPLDLPWDEAPGWDGVPWDRDARPSLDEALAARRERQAQVEAYLATLTEPELARVVTSDVPGSPGGYECPVSECLTTILREEYEHHRYAERDLDRLAHAGAVR